MITNFPLFKKISDFQIDEPNIEKPFSMRLAQENEWTKEYTLQAIDAYKKYMYLAVVAKHNVTPSAVIDKVWHQHILYTKSYLDWCENTLGRFIHHTPSTGQQQSEKYRLAYTKTKELYEKTFDEPILEYEEELPAKSSWKRRGTSIFCAVSLGLYTHDIILSICGFLLLVTVLFFVYEDKNPNENRIIKPINSHSCG